MASLLFSTRENVAIYVPTLQSGLLSSFIISMIKVLVLSL